MIDSFAAALLLAVFPGAAEDLPREPRSTRVLPGIPWHLALQEARPGDQILLDKGFHINGRVVDVHGTREKPIILRGEDPRLPSAIACEGTGLELIRCSWIRVENLYFMNPEQAAIVIDGTPASDPASGAPSPGATSIAIAGCRFETSREVAGMDMVRVTSADTVGIADCRFESWCDAAIDLSDAHSVVVTRCRFVSRSSWTQSAALRATRGTSKLGLLRNIFEGTMANAIELGACSGNGETASVAITGVNVVRCGFIDVTCPISITGNAHAVIDHCTIIEPRVAYALDARCGVPRLTMTDSLLTWTPGRLTAIATQQGEVERAMILLGPNLWWSRELPAAFEALGRPFGVASSPQIVDVDPQIVEGTYEPQEPRAVPFGWTAPNPTPVAPPDREGAPASHGASGTATEKPPARE